MDFIVSFFQARGLDFWQLAKTGGVLLFGTLLISSIGRLAFGKKSTLNLAVSSAIGILFIYCISIVLEVLGSQLQKYIAPLPFITIEADTLYFFPFIGAHYTTVCSQLTSMVILAFLVNLLDAWIPKGKNALTWFIFRFLTVILAAVSHLIVTGLLAQYLPEGIVTYAPTIILGLLLIMLLTGALKLLVGLALSTVNPLIAAFYTFFFANFVGKQVTKAVLTTGLLAGLVLALEYWGVSALAIGPDALIGYLPFALVLLPVWYLVNKVL